MNYLINKTYQTHYQVSLKIIPLNKLDENNMNCSLFFILSIVVSIVLLYPSGTMNSAFQLLRSSNYNKRDTSTSTGKIGVRTVVDGDWLKQSKTHYHLWIPNRYTSSYYSYCSHPLYIWGYDCNSNYIVEANIGYFKERYSELDKMIPEQCWLLSNNSDSCIMYKNRIMEIVKFDMLYDTVQNASVLFNGKDSVVYEGNHSTYSVVWKLKGGVALCYAVERNNDWTVQQFKESMNTFRLRETEMDGNLRVPKD